jgi:hypothetical protein
MRNNHGLYGNRSFSIPTHEQRYMFFSLEDKVNGVMADWIKSVQNENWERHDFDNCTVFNFLSHIHGCKARSFPFMMRFDDTTISSFIDAIRIGLLARFNEMVLNKFCILTSRSCSQNYPILPNINGAKFQSVQQIVNITSNKVGTFKHEITPVSISVPIKKDKIKVGRLEHDTNETKKVRKTL